MRDEIDRWPWIDKAELQTIPAPPPKRDVVEEVKSELSRLRAASRVCIKPQPCRLFVGLVITNHVALEYTGSMTNDEAHEWLRAALPAASKGAWIPTVCGRCGKPRQTPSLCKHCVGGER